MNVSPSLSLRLAVSAVFAAALLAGCASGVKLDQPAPVETRSTATAPGAAASANAGSQSQVASVDAGRSAASEAAAALAKLPKIVYFDFDSFVVKDEYKPVIDANAKALAADRKRHVTVEGHTDERGGREYNLALGQRRSEAVRRALELLGVKDSQVEAVSFGKEKPAMTPGCRCARNRHAPGCRSSTAWRGS